MFPKRLIKPELLDHLSPEDAAPNLAELVRINRHFGGHAVIRRTLARAVRCRDPFTVLDVGAASGDTARLIEALYPSASVTSLDRKDAHLSSAPHPKIAADAFELPFQPGSFDFVLCSLFLHHFRDKQVSELLGILYAKRAGIPRARVEVHRPAFRISLVAEK